MTKALDILKLLQNENETLVPEELRGRAKISKATIYRILKALVDRGHIARTLNHGSHRAARPKKLRFGFGGQVEEMPFAVAVTEGLQAAAGLRRRQGQRRIILRRSLRHRIEQDVPARKNGGRCIWGWGGVTLAGLFAFSSVACASGAGVPLSSRVVLN